MNVIFKTKADALLPISSTARAPLGLAPVLDDEPESERGDGLPDTYLGPERTTAAIVARSISLLSAEQLAAPVSWEDMFRYAIGGQVQQSFEDGDDMRERLRAVRKEIADERAAMREQVAELKLALVEARAEIAAMRSIQETARASTRGERGEPGPRGIPGPPGEGRVGPAGPPGRDAPSIVAWPVDVERFEITPTLSTGARIAPICLMGLFQAYDSAVNEREDLDLASAAEASRDRTEHEAARTRAGLPPR